MTAPWLTILGIGEDGALSVAARAHLRDAALVVGGARHLALAAPHIRGDRLPWSSPMDAAIAAILARRPAAVVVLASGDPYWFGAGTTLARHVPAAETRCIPAPAAFTLACAALGWALQDCETLSFCGRPMSALLPVLQPGARILALSADAGTPAAVAALMDAHGFGPSRLHVLEALGGPQHRVRTSAAAGFTLDGVHRLNMLGIEVAAAPGALVIPLVTGLPEALFEHDGQITKREIRAATLSALAPRRGERLWDVGCGSGSVGIEWCLRHPANRAVGMDGDPDRAARAGRNAASLGVALEVVAGPAPEAMAGLPQPDAVFIGGGAADPGVIAAAWNALPRDGRLVANAVTIETEAALLEARGRLGGSLTRLSVERLDRIGSMHGYRPAMTVTQWLAVKA
ncbi:MAG TPA: precorrin-6y C5,15-methyltransferase (decarboxylating) subunit CbiE [Acetobacteraceae bacterium]